jgi:XTP/dITP diphosphohydrolase
MIQVLFGTNNLHKLREIREMLQDQYQILSLADIGLDLDVAETETTLAGNALLKAKTYHAASGLACFADDTGLEVAALGGAPGVYSARYAGPACRAEDNMEKLLKELQGATDRTARFRTVVAYWDGTTAHTFEGEVVGTIIEAKRGEGGFGYDPLFVPDGFSETFAELSSEAKHAISHRGRAMQKFVSFLQ